MKILGTAWFTEMGASAPIGIVVVELDAIERQAFDNREREAFIGNAVSGNTQEGDVKKIVGRGARFPLDVALKLIG